jgi:hypothetical protein
VYWANWDIARGVTLLNDKVSGYVLDGFGSPHPFGNAPAFNTPANYHPGADTARGIAATTCGGNAGACVAVMTIAAPPTVQLLTNEVIPPPVSGGVALRADGKSGYAVDGYGNITAFGGAPPVASGTWTWNIVRGIALRPDGQSGYILDGWGGVHPFGGAPGLANPNYWSGWDIARGIVLDADGNGGQLIDGFGGIHAFGNAPTLATHTYWANWDVARGLALNPDGQGGQMLDLFGGLHPFGNAQTIASGVYWANWDIARGVTLLNDKVSGYVLDGFGSPHPFGNAAWVSSQANYHPGWDTARGIAAVPCGATATTCAAIYTFGDSAVRTTGGVQVLHN